MWLKQVRLYHPNLRQYHLCCVHIQQNCVKEILPFIDSPASDEEVVSLEGHYLYPGFVDSHCHLLGFGTSLLESNLFDSANQSVWKSRMENDQRDVLIYRGWDEHKTGFYPSKQILDSFSIQKPILLIRKCGHAAVVNSITLQKFPLDAFHQVDGTDLSIGLLTEKALLSLNKQIQSDPSLLSVALTAANRYCQEYGISSVHSEDCSVINMKSMIPLLNNASVRVHEKILVTSPDEMDQVIETYPVLDSDVFSFGSFKIYMDGSLGAHNAFLSVPYSDEPSKRGFCFYTVDELIRCIQTAQHHSKQVAIHVIGDEALELCLQAFEYVSAHSGLTKTHRLVHVQMASNDQLRRIHSLPLVINFQPVFAEADKIMAEKRLGKIRLQRIGHPFRSIRTMRILFSLSSDTPVETMNPFAILSHAEKFMTREEAFYAYTVAGGEQACFSMKTGILMPGSYADGFILPVDLFQIRAEELVSTKPLYVLSNGTILPISKESGSLSCNHLM